MTRPSMDDITRKSTGRVGLAAADRTLPPSRLETANSSVLTGAAKPERITLDPIKSAVIVVKMGFRPDLVDLGSTDSPNRVRHLCFRVGEEVRAPDDRKSPILIRDTWSTGYRHGAEAAPR